MMARRMFSTRIVNSAKFLQMPMESQALYFHLCIRADDDGVVESYPVTKMLGTQVDSFRVLLAKGFIEQLNEEQVIVIVDWLEHNTIRPDRKVDSIYRHLLSGNIKTIAPAPRSDVKDNSRRLGGPSVVGISKGKLSKDNIATCERREQLHIHKSSSLAKATPANKRLPLRSSAAPTATNSLIRGETLEILARFSKLTNRTYKSSVAWEGNYKVWRKTYSLEEIWDAIECAYRYDVWFKENVSRILEVLLRIRDTHNNPVNRIDQILGTHSQALKDRRM